MYIQTHYFAKTVIMENLSLKNDIFDNKYIISMTLHQTSVLIPLLLLLCCYYYAAGFGYIPDHEVDKTNHDFGSLFNNPSYIHSHIFYIEIPSQNKTIHCMRSSSSQSDADMEFEFCINQLTISNVYMDLLWMILRTFPVETRLLFEVKQVDALQMKIQYYAPSPRARSCLDHTYRHTPQLRMKPVAGSKSVQDDVFIVNEGIDPSVPISSIIEFINIKSNSYRMLNESLSSFGAIIRDQTENLFQINSSESTTPTLKSTNESHTDTGFGWKSGLLSPQVCTRIDYEQIKLHPELFINQYWLPQKPVIITNFPAKSVSKTSCTSSISTESVNSILGDILSVGHKKVGVKLSPTRDFEGVDSLQHWSTSSTQVVPRPILDQMVTPDQVVVRAPHASMSINDYISMISKPDDEISTNTNTNITSKSVYAYVEYQDIQNNFPELQSKLLHSEHLLGNPLLDQIFLQGKPYLWLGDGDTVGKLHFDQYDNILVQLEGSKTFRLIDPQRNERMMEGHMREAQLEVQMNHDDKYWKSNIDWSIDEVEPSDDMKTSQTSPSHRSATASTTTGANITSNLRFRKHQLLEATSMVHSPLEFTSTSTKTRFPWSSEIAYMDCTVNGVRSESNTHNDQEYAQPGSTDHQAVEALFVPSFFWHEVLSAPGSVHSFKKANKSRSTRLNVALNYWFAPLYEKEFPCAECRKQLNPLYRHVLESLFAQGLIKSAV